MKSSTTKRLSELIGEVKTPFSYLFVGGDDLTNEEIKKYFVEKTRTIWDDVNEFGRKNEEGSGNSIDEAREFIRKINLTPRGDKRIAFIYQADKLNIHASNALLKTIEEPARAVIMVIFSETENILPTIMSRCEVHRFYGDEDQGQYFNISEMIEYDFHKQVKEIESIIENGETSLFIDDVINYLRSEMINNKKTTFSKMIKEIFGYKRALRNNVSQKMLLELIFLKIKYIL